jgi:hypothetical protein
MLYVIVALLAMILLVQVVMLYALRDYTPAFEALRQQMVVIDGRLHEERQGLYEIEKKIDKEIQELRDVYHAVEGATKTIRGLDESLDKLLKEQTSDLFTGLDQVRQAVDSLSIDLAIRSG